MLNAGFGRDGALRRPLRIRTDLAAGCPYLAKKILFF
jgi:hypothetical protein